MSVGRAIPFTVIGGFLGAGKTTLVNRLLEKSQKTRFAVLVNDFGALNIDRSLITAFDGALMQLSNGCICCSLAGGLVQAMVEVMAKADQIDHILIEASGVSYPSRIMDFARLDADLQANLTLVLVDVLEFMQQRKDPLLRETLEHQLASADLLLLTKTDLASAQQTLKLEVWLAEQYPDTPVLEADWDRLAPEELLRALARQNHESLSEPLPAHGMVSISLTSEQSIDIKALKDLLYQHRGRLLRAKGVLQTQEGAVLYQQVGGQIVLSDYTDDITHSSFVMISTECLDDLMHQLEGAGLAELRADHE